MTQITSERHTVNANVSDHGFIPCQLCHQLTEEQGSSTSKSINHLWSYLYHQNVREALLPTPMSPQNSVLGEPIPKLTFTFSFGDENISDIPSNPTVLCTSCSVELEKLENSHQELEQVKKSIESQVNRIQCNIRSVRDFGMDNGDQSDKTLSTPCWKGPIPNLCMAGSSVGKENISQALRFLTYICDGMSPSSSGEFPGKTGNHNSINQVGSDVTMNENDKDDSIKCPGNPLEPTPCSASSKTHEIQDNSQLQSSLLMEVVVEEPTIVKIDHDVAQQSHGPDHIDTIMSSYITPDIDCPATLETGSDVEEEGRYPLDETSQSSIVINVNIPKTTRKRKRNFSRVGKKQCPVCFQFFDPSYLSVHKRIHTGVKPYRCEVCNNHFRTIQTLKVHRRTHTKPQNSKRRKLQTSFPVVKIDPVDVASVSCTLDGRQGRQEGPLILQPDQVVEDFIPETSDQDSDQDPLAETNTPHGQQLQLPSEDSKKQCPTCSKIISRSSFRAHLKIHTGEKPYVCEVCRKGFRQYGTLKRHKMSHTGERAFKCDICSKEFYERRDLNKHRQNMHK